MSSLRLVVAPPADQLALELPGVPPLAVVHSGPPRPVGRVRSPRPERSVAGAGISPRERVWLVWEDDEVLGVYGDPDVAATDVCILRRNALRAGIATTYEYLPVPVFAAARHGRGC